VVIRLAVPLALPAAAVAQRDVSLHAEDRLDTGFSSFFLEFPGGVYVPVIRDSEGWLLEFERPRDQVVNAICAVEKGVFRVAVKMNEGHL